jgi:hypothetical protein
MTGTRRILLSVVVALVALGVLALAVGAWWVSSLYESEQTDGSGAAAAFDDVRTRFGTRPVFEIQGERLARTREPETAQTRAVPESAFLVVWEPQKRLLSRVRVPLWLSKVATEPIPLEALTGVGARGLGALPEAQQQANALNLRLADLERYGPTLLLDGITRDGTHVLMWSE